MEPHSTTQHGSTTLPVSPSAAPDGDTADTSTGFTSSKLATFVVTVICMVSNFVTMIMAAHATPVITDKAPWVVIIATFGIALVPLALRHRDDSAESLDRLSITAAVLTLLLPIGPAFAATMLGSLIARRTSNIQNNRLVWMQAISIIVTSFRDAFLPGDGSIIRMILTDSHNPDVASAAPPQGTVLISDLICGTAWILVAVLTGLNERHRAVADTAVRKSAIEQTKTKEIQSALINQQFADAVAAEAHDTLAHSLTDIAMNSNLIRFRAEQIAKAAQAKAAHTNAASDPKAGTAHTARIPIPRHIDPPFPDDDEPRASGLGSDSDTNPGSDSILEQASDTETTAAFAATADIARLAEDIAMYAENIRREAAGALDETHGIIDVLRHPDREDNILMPRQEISLAYDSLKALLEDARSAGLRIDTWINLENCEALDPAISTLAYRIVQEGLTNAQRHAPGTTVSLQVRCAEGDGVSIDISNEAPDENAPITADAPSATADTRKLGGTGLAALKQRVESVGGSMLYGLNWRHVFNLHVSLPQEPLAETAD